MADRRRRRAGRRVRGLRSTDRLAALRAGRARWPRGSGAVPLLAVPASGADRAGAAARGVRVTGDIRRLDPDLPLPPAPDPWVSSSMPPLRTAPPYLMTEMIEAEPALAARVLERLAAPDGATARLAAVVRDTAERRGQVLVTGCGTSEHGALAIVEILRDSMRAAGLPWQLGRSGVPVAVQAFEGALEPELIGPGDALIGVSHEGGTWATNLALEWAKASGATVALISASDRSPGAAMADLVVVTGEQDQGWCHTVGYLSPIVAALAVAGHISGRAADARAVRDLLSSGLLPAAVRETEGVARALADLAPIVVSASGTDRAAARELVLKIEEGAHVPASMRDLETVLHGHLAGMDRGTGFVLILTDPARADERVTRATGVLRAVREIGIGAAAIVGAGHAARIPNELTPLGRMVVPPAPGIPPAAASLLGSAVPLQLLAERLARARGVNPDPIRRDDPAYLRAADAAS